MNWDSRGSSHCVAKLGAECTDSRSLFGLLAMSAVAVVMRPKAA